MLTRTRAALAVAAAACLAGVGTACSSPSPQPPAESETAGAPTPTAAPTATAPPSPQMWNGMTGEEIVTQAGAALRGTSSYRVAGTLAEGNARVELDAIYAGDDRQGTWRSGAAAAEVVRINEKTYVLGNAEYWEHIVYEETAATLDGKWVELDGPYAAYGASLVPDIATLLTPVGVLQPDEERTVDGRQALTLSDGVITVAVAIEEPRYPLRIDTDAGTSLALSDFDASVTIQAPPGEPRSLATVTGNA